MKQNDILLIGGGLLLLFGLLRGKSEGGITTTEATPSAFSGDVLVPIEKVETSATAPTQNLSDYNAFLSAYWRGVEGTLSAAERNAYSALNVSEQNSYMMSPRPEVAEMYRAEALETIQGYERVVSNTAIRDFFAKHDVSIGKAERFADALRHREGELKFPKSWTGTTEEKIARWIGVQI